MKRYSYLIIILCFLGACSALGFKDTVYVIDSPNGNLRGHDANGADDKPLSDCDPVPHPSPSAGFEYKCVAHFIPQYHLLLDEIDRLQKELIACQQSHTN